MALIKFKLDGRSVSGITVHRLPSNAGGDILKSAASCSTCFGDGNIFLGSENADSVLLEWSHSSASTKKARLGTKQVVDGAEVLSEDDQMEDDIYDDDLYSSAPGPAQADHRMGTDNSTQYYNFRLNDRLLNIGPLRDITLGKAVPKTIKDQPNSESVSSELELVAAQGSDRGGGLLVIKREIDPLTTMSLQVDEVNGVWSAIVTPGKIGLSSTSPNQSRQYLVISRSTDSDQEVNEVFSVDEDGLKPFKASEFNPNEDYTIDIGSLADNTRLVQVLRNEVRSYDIGMVYPESIVSVV
jgi:cleavage and polyadenylation specificity factor subunit 1